MPLHLLLMRTFQVVSALVASMGAVPRPAPPREPVEAREEPATLPEGGGGCVLVAHAGACMLDALVVQPNPASGVREVVAVYRTVGAESARYAERRYRVAYLGVTEDEQMTFLREHAAVTCRWQTVQAGRCEAAPAEVDVPRGVEESFEAPAPDRADSDAVAGAE